MSGKSMGQVWDIQLKSQGERLVLLALADHADHLGERAYPGVPLLAWKTDLTERQIQRHLSALRGRGVIELMNEGKGGRGIPAVYRIRFDRAPLKPEYQRTKDDAHDTLSTELSTKDDTGDTLSANTVTPTTPFTGMGDTHDAVSPADAKKGEADVTVSAPETQKGDIRRHKRVTSQSKRVTSEPVKGDIAMSPEPLNRPIEPSENHARARAGGPPTENLVVYDGSLRQFYVWERTQTFNEHVRHGVRWARWLSECEHRGYVLSPNGAGPNSAA